MDRFATVEEKQIFGYIVKQPYLGFIRIYTNIIYQTKRHGIFA